MIKTTVKKLGFESVLYRGNGTKEKVVIVISGSNGGMRLTEKKRGFIMRTASRLLLLQFSKRNRHKKILTVYRLNMWREP